MREIFLVSAGWQDRGCVICRVAVDKETKKRLYLSKHGTNIVGEWFYIPAFVEIDNPYHRWFDTLEEAKSHILTQLDARLRGKRHDLAVAEAALIKAHKDLEGI